MKKIFIFLMINVVAISAFTQDWRKGNYRNPQSENFVMVNLDGRMMMGENSELNPLGYGFSLGFQHKTARKKGYVTTAHGFGGYLGLLYYGGTKVTKEPIGTSDILPFSEYNSFAYMPLMLSYNFYITHKNMHYFVGLDLGVQMMIKERDNKGTMISYYNGENEIKISHVLPSGKFYLGAMYELNQDFRIRGQIGVDYTKGYNFDAITPYYYRDAEGAIKEAAPVGEIHTIGLLNLSASIGVVYSL